ncbi:MAG TPA: hypothetical protein VFV87_15690 [Pirellulaceae bacterium]|nr:hypothetical protein [Pirellulaceae bacterium]
MTTDIPDLDAFYGDLTPARAYVYARLPRPADAEGLTLSGQVRGPRCKLAQTLPTTSPLVDLGPGPTLLARALVPDPVFWSPDLPAIYDVTVNLLRGTEILATAQRQIGLRSLGVRDRDLLLNGKRWVLRGVSADSTTSRNVTDWHDAAAVYVHDDSPVALRVASESGVLAMSVVLGEHLNWRIRLLANYPAVAICVPDRLPADFRKAQAVPNLILAQRLSRDATLTRQPWADVVLVTADDTDLVRQAVASIDAPIIAARYRRPPADIATARAACDALQRDLAPLGQFAGYVV